MRRFEDIVGQEQLRDHLENAVKLGKVSHAYLINGERSSGKEFIAKIFAQALQCENRQGADPCGECHSCVQAESGNHPDIIFLTHEKPNVISVEDIRTQINNDMSIKPYSGRWKIYIVNEAEKMTVQAQNALLKTLEEPPEYGVILLLVSNVNALLPTILSRCVQLNMKPVRDAQVKDYLMKTMQIPDYKADICVAFARGNVGKAKRLALSDSFGEMLEHALHMVKYISDRIGVLHLGHLLETGTTDEIFANPVHPYTRSLLSAIPEPNPRVEKYRKSVTYDYATSGIDYNVGSYHSMGGQHQVFGTDEEIAKWTSEKF